MERPVYLSSLTLHALLPDDMPIFIYVLQPHVQAVSSYRFLDTFQQSTSTFNGGWLGGGGRVSQTEHVAWRSSSLLPNGKHVPRNRNAVLTGVGE